MFVGSWKYLGSAVWEHTSGARIHTYGMLRLPSGVHVNGQLWPESKTLREFIRIHGGNNRRGVMA